MSGPALTAFWRELDPALAQGLALGSLGRGHLLEQARAALDLGSPLAAELVQAALAESPLDGGLAREALALPPVVARLPRACRDLLEALAPAWRVPAGDSGYAELAASRDLPALWAFLDAVLARDPGNLFWRNQALTLALFENDRERLAAALDFSAPPALAPALAALRGLAAHLAGDFETAGREYAAGALALGPACGLTRRGLARLGAGDRAGALECFRASLDAAPWQATPALLASDLARGADRALAALPGSLVVLLYSWNKAAELEATLEALLASDLGRARVLVLDNGSTDATPQVLSAWRERAGERLSRLDLPVNVGAPAARNWLLARPEVAEADFALYLDDDALVPGDWLGRFGAAVAARPAAGVWGCRVLDAAAPHLVQSADLHLRLPAAPDPQRPAEFRLSDLHIQGFDLGQFGYLRPCASVTGCCHLFRTRELLDSGGFSLHLSPSQYDDVERDLRMLAAGKTAVCQGHLAVRHCKRTGAASRLSPAEEGNALGNKFKVQALHPREELERSRDLAAAAVWADLLERLAELDRE